MYTAYGGFTNRVTSQTTVDETGSGWLGFETRRRSRLGFKVRIVFNDDYGVLWGTDHDTEFEIPKKDEVDSKTGVTTYQYEFVLNRAPRQDVPRIWLNPFLEQVLINDPSAVPLVHDWHEMLEVLELGYPTSAAALSGRVLEGILQLRGEKEGWWKEKWETKPLGTMLHDPDLEKIIRDRFGDGWLKRLQSLNALRILGAHSKGITVTMSDSAAAATGVTELLVEWMELAARDARRGRRGY